MTDIDPYTVIDEPGVDAGEVDMLLFAVERSRAQFIWKAGGLDETALRRPFPPSTMTLGGLLKHLTLVEDSKVAWFVTGEPLGPPWSEQGFEESWEWCWTSAADDSAEELYASWRAAVDRARAAWARAINERGLDGPSTYVLPDGRAVNLRRFLVDLHDEYARHTGHADLFREAIDGLAGEDPPQP